MEILTLSNISKDFDGFRAVDNLSLTLKSGEILGFLGPNGAGKTTTIRMICGLIRPTSGEIRILGINPVKNPGKARKNIGYMPQIVNLYGDLTVLENFELFGGLFSLPKDIIKRRKEELGELLGLGEWWNHLLSEIPHGIRQRVGLALSLLHDPPLLLLDEPTSGADPIARRWFWHLIRNLANLGKGIVVTTHYMEEALNCDRILLIHKGKKLVEGKLDELLKKFPFRALKIDVENLPLTLRILKGKYPAFPYGRSIEVVLRGEEERELIKLISEKTRILRIEERELSLDHLFAILVK
jgi:ABC-2 type transport system ATP-binding protein